MTAQEPFNKRCRLHVDAPFGANSERFHLDIKRLIELEGAFDAGPLVIYRRLSEGTCRHNELRETLRLGLIGGGKTPAEAFALVSQNHDGFPLETNLALALSIVHAVLFGYPKEPEDQAEIDDGEAHAPAEDQPQTPTVDQPEPA